MLLSEYFVDSAVQCQWHIELAWWESPGYVELCLLHLFTPPKHSQIYYPSHSFSPLFLFLCAIYLPYFLLTSFDLSFQISCCSQVASVCSQGSFLLLRGHDWGLCHSHWTIIIFLFLLFLTSTFLSKKKSWMRWFKEMRKMQIVMKISVGCLFEGLSGIRCMYLKQHY